MTAEPTIRDLPTRIDGVDGRIALIVAIDTRDDEFVVSALMDGDLPYYGLAVAIRTAMATVAERMTAIDEEDIGIASVLAAAVAVIDMAGINEIAQDVTDDDGAAP